MTNLTKRELEIAELIKQGYSNKEIARICSNKVGTVKQQICSIYRKLGISSRYQLIRGYLPK